jgi:hypothetical protein
MLYNGSPVTLSIEAEEVTIFWVVIITPSSAYYLENPGSPSTKSIIIAAFKSAIGGWFMTLALESSTSPTFCPSKEP